MPFRRLNRERAVGRLDRLVRLMMWLGTTAILALLALLAGNRAYYGLAKRDFQVAASLRANIDPVELPPGAQNWRLPPENQGDPFDDLIRAQLDFRAYEKDYIATKLLGVPLPSAPQATIVLLQAARRTPRELTLEQELALRPLDLRDAANALLRDARTRRAEAARLVGSTDSDIVSRGNTLRREAEERIRAYYTTGLYLATRRFSLQTIIVGCTMMREGADALYQAAVADLQQERAARLDEFRGLMNSVAERLDEIQGYRDDDSDLETWVLMLERSRSPAVRMHAAGLLAQVARQWWRYGESTRAIAALRRSLTGSYNFPLRAALFDLIDGAERNLPQSPGMPLISRPDESLLRSILNLLT